MGSYSSHAFAERNNSKDKAKQKPGPAASHGSKSTSSSHLGLQDYITKDCKILRVVCLLLDCRAARPALVCTDRARCRQAAHAYLVHEGLCERGLINLVVAMLAVAHNVHHHIALPLLAPLCCQLTSTHLQISIITVRTTITIMITVMMMIMITLSSS